MKYTSCIFLVIAFASYASADWTAIFTNKQLKSTEWLHGRNKREAMSAIIIHRLESTTSITARFSDTKVESEIENIHFDSDEIVFQTQLPKNAFISNFSMVIDGTEYVGIVKEKAAAQKEFQEAKDRGVSAGLVQTQQRETQWFKVSVNVESFASVVFKLRYHQLLERKLGRYEQVVFADPGLTNVEKFSVKVFISEPTGINSLDALQPFKGTTNDSPQDDDFSLVVRKSKTQASVSYFKANFNPPSESGRRFVVRYDVDRPNEAGDVWQHNGYFVHFLAPTLESLPKRIVFVVDTSGSMGWGNKMEQTKDALQTIIPQMNKNDLFNIVTFESQVDTWRSSLQGASKINEALTFVRNLQAQGGTNLNQGVMTAIRLLDDTALGDEIVGTSAIFVLTDGNPTSGVTDFEQIKNNIRSENVNKYPIFTLGFGSDVNQDFLLEIALENQGINRKIYAESDAADQLEGFFSEVANPLLMNLTVTYNGNIEALTNNKVSTYFGGTEMVVVGKYKTEDGKEPKIEATIEGIGKDGKFSRTIASSKLNDEFGYPVSDDVTSDFNIFFERMWAYLTVSQLIKREIVERDQTESNKLRKDILETSLNFNFVTPLTAMIAQKPTGQDDEVTEISDKKPIELPPTSSQPLQISSSGNIGRSVGGSSGFSPSSGFSSSIFGGGGGAMSFMMAPAAPPSSRIIGGNTFQRGFIGAKRTIATTRMPTTTTTVLTTTPLRSTTITTTQPTTTTTTTTLAPTPQPSLGDVPMDPNEFDTECGFSKSLVNIISVKSQRSIYVANSTCKWTISNPSDNNLMELVFKKFDLEDDANCRLDRVIVYSDGDEVGSMKHETFCGYEGVKNLRITSQKKFVIIFQSDAQVQGKGFKAVITPKQ